MARRQRNIRRNRIVLREIVAPAKFATDLYHRAYRPHRPALGATCGPDHRGVRPLLAIPRGRLHGPRRGGQSCSPYGRPRLTTDSPADIQREIDDAGSEFDRLFLLLVPELRSWALRVEAWQRGRWRGAVLSATGVDL